MMSYPTASYDQLVRQVEDLRKENSHLRRELQDNSHHLSKLENETSDMKEVLRQLQSKLEQEAGTLASSGRTDVLDQLKELHMDLTNYYELKYQPHNLRVFPEMMASQVGEGEEKLSIGRARSPACPPSRQSSSASGEGTAVHPHQATGEGLVTAQHLEDLCKERSMLLSEIEKEERERRWYYSQLQGLSQRLSELPRLDTFSMQVDFIRQQLEFEAQQLRSVMEERFGTSDEMVQRTQIRVARLEQLEKELQEAQSSRGPQEKSALPETQSTECLSKASDMDTGSAGTLEAPGEAGSKVEMVFWLLSMLASRDREEMSRTLLAMSSSQESCIAMRKSGCVPLLVQILHEGGTGEAAGTGGYSREAHSRASAALHNIVYSQPDEGQARREMRVLHVLDQIRSHCENGWDWIENHLSTPSPGGGKSTEIPEPVDPQMCQALCAIMKLSFEEEYRRAMNELGGLQAIAELIQLDQELYGMQNEPINMALRRYAGMALTNLTYGDVVNKATLCSKKNCLQAIVVQLASDSEELQQVVSSILRNLSWRADINSKRALRDVGSVSALMTCALQATKESTLKSVLSALWNLSAHSTENKVAICSVDGALGFLVSTLTYRCQTNSLAIIESGGGILRNVSSLIATRDDYRRILRDHNCLQTLLQHLRSHSLTIVSNACGTLWNLSARSPKDQELLWDLGAVSMLRNLIHSKHKMIAMGSAAALRNLLTNRPLKYKNTAVISPGSCMPSLYMRKQKALEAELDAKHLTETFDSIEKQSFKHQSINKPLRHIESLAKDYASDSGCFDDDEAPNVSTSLDTGTFSMLSMFLNNSNFLNTQPRKRDGEPEQDVETFQTENKRSQPPDDEVTVAAEKLAKKITNTVAKIDKLVEDITMHTSSEDSFSLSSEDHFVDWNYGPDELHEARAISCSPCHLSDTSSFSPKEHLSRAHAFLHLKTANSSLSNDSLNSGSTSDGYCGSQDQTHTSAKPTEQRRPNKLDLKVTHEEPVNSGVHISRVMCQNEIPERDFETNKDAILPDLGSTDTEKSQEPFISTPTTVSTKVSSDASIPTVKLSPSYQHVPLIQSVVKFGIAKTAVNVQATQAMRRQTWVPTVMTGGSISKFSPICSARSPTIGQLETPQKYSIENTPICFSRCSSLSSLSSGDGALDGQSQTENELESDSSLEIIEVEDVNVERKDEEDETLDDLSDSQLLLTDQKISSSDPTEIPSTIKNEKRFLRGVSPVILEDRTPSSSSENYILETPLVMSRCSSVSSLGSFESPSIASSIQSDPCSEMISGTVSPSDLPDSPGQTMPPSRSKTPCCAESSGPETQNLSGVGSQWENSLRKFMEIADFKERFNLPPDLDTMIYFTVEKPIENFSCASSLSALPLHEHYVQKDVELKLTPLLNQQDNDPEDSEKEEDMDDQEQYSEGNSDDDIEILKECINSAMPSRFKKVRPTVMSNLSNQVLNMQSRKSVQLPVYMVLQNKNNQMCTGQKLGMSSKEIYHDDSSYTDSAEGTPINFSSTTSLSDETLQCPLRTKGIKDWRRNKETQELIDIEAKRIEDLRMFSRFHKPTKMTCQSHIVTNQLNKKIRHMVPTQRLLIQSKEMAAKMTQQRIESQSPVRQIQKQGQNLSKSMPQLDILIRKQNTEVYQNQKTCSLSHAQENTLAFQSRHHPTTTEVAICHKMDRQDGLMNRTGQKQHYESSKTNVIRNANIQDQVNCYQSRQKGFHRIKQNLILEEAPPCYSLSSSLSYLSDAEFEEHHGKPQHTWIRNKQNITSKPQCPPKSQQERNQFEENSSPSSVSMDSEDDLLIKCITSAMPQHKKKQAARKKKAEKKHKQKATLQKATEWSPENDLDSDEMASDKDSDLNSVEWRAIQEGANTIITKLQASKSQEPSSESESVLSFMSGSSFTPKEKKVYKDDKKANKPLDFAPRKPVPNLPVVFRGRTVIYTPKKEITLSQRPPPKKVTQKADAPKNPDLAQHRSRSLHRLGHPMDSTLLSLPKRSSTPPARIPKSSSSGSSQSSTPSRHPQRKVTSPTQTIKQGPENVASAPCSPPDKRGSTSNTNQNSKSPIDRKTQKSPVRIPFMQNPSRQTRNISPLVTNQPTSISRQNTQMSGKRILPANRLDLVRMTSTHSSSGESDRNGFLRQLTFIKESSKVSRRDASSRSVPTSQHASPRRAVPGAPAVFLCSSRCQELKEAVQGPRRMPVTQGQRQVQEQGVIRQGMAPSRATSIDRDVTVKCPARRTSSESPCRASQRNAPGPKPREKREDTFKRYSSSPSINVLSRVTSRSSLRSSSSDSSGRAKSERNTNQRQKRAGSRNSDKVTWRRIRDEDVPQILKSTLPPTALPLLPSPEGAKQMPPPLPGKLPTITLASRKTSDATVQTEDYSANKTNSSTSPTIEKVLGITDEATKMALSRKISMAFGNTLQDGDSDGSLKTYSTASTSTFQSVESSHNGGVGHFRQSSPSKAVRVTPFNYIPSPMVCCSPQTHGQAQTMPEKTREKHEA
ncbi:adenomatous polyposis coli protein 2-like [Sinocyclocheilus rhinocerous]|uniref:adenomatous polyposis coli protein 2-like n=1 Tax=Sinocyclocheilus rhinocerous TaxID=307959 RepID=UPI0007B7D037|nr:PREDICTED: adenomatous polyposis coli protein 2-like [Sinocyclocheilus rhinocerous]XP_016414694.1 PREDICTED: adenomatous polyposis coli protein 2-like [Sinocyclocheilus rhinocerous]